MKRFSSPSRLAGREDLLTAAKAIHDGVVDEMNGSWKDGLVMQLCKMFEAEMAKRIDAVREQFEDRVATLETALEEAKAEHGKSVAELEQNCSNRVEGLRLAYEEGLGQVKTLLEKMESPTFQAVVPENAIQINQLPSVVNLPENAIRVGVEVPRRRTTKRIEYDPATGRPSTIHEEEAS